MCSPRGGGVAAAALCGAVWGGGLTTSQAECGLRTGQRVAKARDLSGDRPCADAEQQRRDLTLARFKFRDLADIQARFPFEMLRVEDGVAMYRGRVIVVQPLVFDVLEREFDAVPASLGRQRLLSFMRTKYWGVSASQVARFLATHLVHQEYRPVSYTHLTLPTKRIV